MQEEEGGHSSHRIEECVPASGGSPTIKERFMKNKFVMIACMFLLGAGSIGFCAGFGVNKNQVYPRIITPNGDGKNDLFWVFYENPLDNEVHGKIYTIDGAEVADMKHKTGSAEYSLCWDGCDGSGGVVPAGVYIYQLNAEDSVFNGTVVVAR